jgi:subtilisin family serine protease
MLRPGNHAASAVLLAVIAWALAATSVGAFVGVTPDLTERVSSLTASEKVRVNVILWAQHDPQALRAELSPLRGHPLRAALWKEVEERTTETQAPVRAVIDELVARGDATEPRILYSANGLNLWLTPAGVSALAARPEVRSLDWDEDRPIEEVIDAVASPAVPATSPSAGTAAARGASAPTWSIDRINAPDVWALGYTGQGQLIGVIDTGVNYHHADLQDHMWDGGAQFPNHGYDFVNNDNNPIDEGHSGGHGTSVAGLCCGDGTSGTATGVAPDATIMAIRCSGFSSSESIIWSGQDFALEHGADVITMSLSWKFHFSPDYATWRAQEDMIRAADVAHSQSAGNQHVDPCCPTPWNVSAPGNCPAPWLHPDQSLLGGLSGVTAVADVGISDVVASTSSHGPASWETIPAYGDYAYDPEMGLLKPDVAAPGLGTTSLTWNNNAGYSGFGGTSAASPHVGGTYCLLRGAYPELTVEDLSRVIQLSAVDLGPSGKDNRYGAGRIDALAAHLMAEPAILDPPTGLVAVDTPGDDGGSIDLAWVLSADDGSGNGRVQFYEVLRTTAPGTYFEKPIASLPAGTTSYQDESAVDFVDYYYVVHATGDSLRSVASNEAGPVHSEPQVLAAGETPATTPFLSVLGPNPFTTGTELGFAIGGPGGAELAIYNVAGGMIRRLAAGPLALGAHRIAWDGRDSRGRAVPGGIYVATLTSRDLRLSQKLIRLH